MDRAEIFTDGLRTVTARKREQRILDGWFLFQETKMGVRCEMVARGLDPDAPGSQAEILCECVRRMPLTIPEGSAIAGTQDDAFSPSYALINPAFRIETFAGYCDPLAVYEDIAPSAAISAARIRTVRDYYASTRYVRDLYQVYRKAGEATKEVAFFVEPVTGHVIPDFRPILAQGTRAFAAASPDRGAYSRTMKDSLEAAVILAGRYAELANALLAERRDPAERERLKQIAANCLRVPASGARTLHEAIQGFALLWQVMCLEQAPNPYAFSVGNLDRILAPYLGTTSPEEAVALIRHLLAFFMVGDRCWAISQNIMVSGKGSDGKDASNAMTYLVLQAFFLSNNPQPALSVKLHRNTPEEIYRRMGEFFFTPGHSTPSLFNDDMMFKLLGRKGIRRGDRSDYAIAGCQEPLVTGKENANTTNSWLNLAKILELTLNDGKSLISGTKIGLSWRQLGYRDFAAVCQDIETAYWKQFDHLAGRMVLAANNCVKVLGKVAVPFSSAVQGCLATGRDMRHATRPGTAYSGSGCLVHGLSVLTDSLIAVKQFMKSGTVAPADLLVALRTDFLGQDRLREFLLSAEKYGNNCPGADRLAARLAKEVSRRISAYRNPAGFPFTPDFSTPTTHLLYGYWVGATPDGRKAREMLGYGIDPRPGVARKGLQERMLSTAKLPFASFTGGYASHIGLAPRDFAGMPRKDEKGMALRDRVISPLFGFAEGADGPSPFYVYFNIDDATHLRKVMEQPGKHAPSGVYIMRIHGTFVNFLDLSPAIQEDILARLDPPSTALGR